MSDTLQYISGVAWPWFVSGLIAGEPACLAVVVVNAALLWSGLKHRVGVPRIALAAALLLTGASLAGVVYRQKRPSDLADLTKKNAEIATVYNRVAKYWGHSSAPGFDLSALADDESQLVNLSPRGVTEGDLSSKLRPLQDYLYEEAAAPWPQSWLVTNISALANVAVALIPGIFVVMLLLAKKDRWALKYDIRHKNDADYEAKYGDWHENTRFWRSGMQRHVGLAGLSLLLVVLAARAGSIATLNNWDADGEYLCFVLSAYLAWLGFRLSLREFLIHRRRSRSGAAMANVTTQPSVPPLDLSKLDGEPL